jgi:ABC-type sugar transport system permease subunit
MMQAELVAPRLWTHRARRHWTKHRAGYLFVLPAFLLYAVFVIYPFLQSFYFSLTSWNGVSATKDFIGLDNYRALIRDDLLWKSLKHNLIWVVLGTIGPMAIGLFLAVLLWSRPRGFTLFRTVYFMPQVLSPVIIAIVWGWIYNPIFGILNKILERLWLGDFTRGWIGDPDVALYALIATAIWSETGFVFVIFLAGLQNVSRDLMDAAMIDGANAWQRFWNVMVPQLANVITVVTALLLVGGFSVFDIVFVMTGGGPSNATEVIASYTYKEAFTQNHVGYAASLSLVMTVLSLIASVAFIWFREREERT